MPRVGVVSSCPGWEERGDGPRGVLQCEHRRWLQCRCRKTDTHMLHTVIEPSPHSRKGEALERGCMASKHGLHELHGSKDNLILRCSQVARLVPCPLFSWCLTIPRCDVICTCPWLLPLPTYLNSFGPHHQNSQALLRAPVQLGQWTAPAAAGQFKAGQRAAGTRVRSARVLYLRFPSGAFLVRPSCPVLASFREIRGPPLLVPTHPRSLQAASSPTHSSAFPLAGA